MEKTLDKIDEQSAKKEQIDIGFDEVPMNELPDDYKIYGIKKIYIEKYIQQKSEYYVDIFDFMEAERVYATWNWSAFFFGPIFYFFRKMYAVSLAFVTFLGVYIGAFSVYLGESVKYIIQKQQVTYLYTTIFSSKYIWFSQLMVFLTFFLFLVMMLSGFFANHIYRIYVIDSIKKIKDEFSDNDDFLKNLPIYGGTNKSTTTVLSILIFIILAAFVLLSLYTATRYI